MHFTTFRSNFSEVAPLTYRSSSKSLSGLSGSRLSPTLSEGNKLFSLNQHGFRSGRNCLTQLLHHVDDILKDLSTDANADVIYLDFSKAFDKVDHKILLKKLSSFGIGGNLLRWINSFLSGSKQYVVVERLESGTIIVLSGVPQGTVLGPLLFLLYINDMEEVVKHCLLKIFADDSKLHKKIRSHLDRLLLQQDLESVFTWASENNMDLNQDKFELLQLGRNPDLKHPYTLPSGQELLGSIELC
jgi:ribonuclease P/MRP protein subunit RPP40